MKINMEIIGRLTRDAELVNYNGSNFVSFTIVASESWNDKSGAKQTRDTFVKCTKSVQEGSRLAEYLKKADIIAVNGKPSVSAFKKKNGDNGAELKMNVNNLTFIQSSPKKEGDEVAEVKAPSDEPIF